MPATMTMRAEKDGHAPYHLRIGAGALDLVALDVLPDAGDDRFVRHEIPGIHGNPPPTAPYGMR